MTDYKCKYYKQIKQISYDYGQTWHDTSDYRKGEIYEFDSEDCSEQPPTPPTVLPNYLKYVASEDGYFEWIVDSSSQATLPDYEYSKDGINWSDIPTSMPLEVKVNFSSGETIYFRNNEIVHGYQWTALRGGLYIKGKGSLEGNILSLCLADFEGVRTLAASTSEAFRGFFHGGDIEYAHDLLLPTNIAGGYYMEMFKGCSKLKTLPELPATNLSGGTYCYLNMFSDCTSLTSIPSDYLSASTLSEGCYHSMFSGCTSLSGTPILSAATMQYSCYEGMFKGCTGLTTAGQLPSTTIAPRCYYEMFSGCTSLSNIPYTNMLPATNLDDECYTKMFAYCTSLTTAPYMGDISCWAPFTGSEGMLQLMFYNCSSLNYVRCLANGNTTQAESGNSAFKFWLSGVSPTGTFVEKPGATWPRHNSGIPSGWTVIDAT